MEDLNLLILNLQNKYTSLLNYFGEESQMPSHEFFSIVHKFNQEFISAREVVERQAKLDEEKKAMENAKLLAANAASAIVASSIANGSGNGDSINKVPTKKPTRLASVMF